MYQRSRSTVHGADIATLSPISGATHFGRDLHIPEEELNRIFSEPTPVEFNLEETGVFIHLRGQVMDGRRHLTVRMVNRIEPEGDTLSAVGRATIFQCELRVNAAEFVDARWESDLETDLATGILYDSTILAAGTTSRVIGTVKGRVSGQRGFHALKFEKCKRNRTFSSFRRWKTFD